MTVRAATVEDAPAMASIAVAGWRWAYGSFLDPEFLERNCDVAVRTERMQKRWGIYGPSIVAVDDEGGVIGWATDFINSNFQGADAEIGGLYVQPDSARSGVGRALFETLKNGFIERGCRSMAVNTLAQNEIGCGFYEKMGGRRELEEEWNGYPSVWFVWDLS